MHTPPHLPQTQRGAGGASSSYFRIGYQRGAEGADARSARSVITTPHSFSAGTCAPCPSHRVVILSTEGTAREHREHRSRARGARRAVAQRSERRTKRPGVTCAAPIWMASGPCAPAPELLARRRRRQPRTRTTPHTLQAASLSAQCDTPVRRCASASVGAGRARGGEHCSAPRACERSCRSCGVSKSLRRIGLAPRCCPHRALAARLAGLFKRARNADASLFPLTTLFC